MKDILLDKNGDIFLNAESDIVLTDSVLQAVRIRLKWFLGECPLYDEDIGTDYYGVILVKNPDKTLAATEIRSQIMLVDEVTEVLSVNIDVDSKTRKGKISYTFKTDKETYGDEVNIWQSME